MVGLREELGPKVLIGRLAGVPVGLGAELLSP